MLEGLADPRTSDRGHDQPVPQLRLRLASGCDSPVVRENPIRLASVDFLTFVHGPWDHDLMAPSGLGDPLRGHPRFQALLEGYGDDVEGCFTVSRMCPEKRWEAGVGGWRSIAGLLAVPSEKGQSLRLGSQFCFL